MSNKHNPENEQQFSNLKRLKKRKQELIRAIESKEEELHSTPEIENWGEEEKAINQLRIKLKTVESRINRIYNLQSKSPVRVYEDYQIHNHRFKF